MTSNPMREEQPEMTTQVDAVDLDVYGLTHVGKVRKHNEDQFLIASLRKTMDVRHTSVADLGVFAGLKRSEAELFLVADGVGGVPGGEQASSTAVAAVTRFITHTAGCYYNADVDQEHEFLEQLERSVERCHESLIADYGSEGGPATTLTLVWLIWPRAYMIHVGDSRCYYLRDSVLRQLTRDQTMGEVALDQGLLSEEEVQRRGLDHILTSAIGAQISPRIGLIDLEAGDTLLLCTDGLTKHVSEDQILAVLRPTATAQKSCEQLVEAALQAGGSDNVTVVVARMNGVAERQ